MMAGAARFAVYWVPESAHPLWSAGCQWLGRDPEQDAPGHPPVFARAAWRYGFHATLKAPLRLHEGRSELAFLSAVQDLAARTADFDMPRLQVAWLGGFLALRPVVEPDPASALRQLADACVQGLDAWRAPEDPAAVAARRAKTTTEAQRLMLTRWGYPHVMEQWRFHLSLSDVGPPEPEALAERARRHFAAALATPLRAGQVAVFREAAVGEPLQLLLRCRLQGA